MAFNQHHIIRAAQGGEKSGQFAWLTAADKVLLAEQGHIRTGTKKAVTVLARRISLHPACAIFDHSHLQT